MAMRRPKATSAAEKGGGDQKCRGKRGDAPIRSGGERGGQNYK